MTGLRHEQRVLDPAMRAAVLSVMMNLTPIASVDILRFLNVPAIVLRLNARRGRACADRACGSRRRSERRAS